MSLLALFEVPTPGYPKIVRHWRSYFVQSKLMLSGLVRGEDRMTWADLRSHARVLKGLVKRKSEALIRRELIAAGLKSVVDSTERNKNRNKCAGRSYDPKHFAGNVVQFIAADEGHSTVILDDPRFGWRDVVGQGFSVRRVSGRADAIFKRPCVGELASQLRAVLDGINAS